MKNLAKFFNHEQGGCMDTQQVKREYRMSEWAQIIKDRKECGQTIKEFCGARGISGNTYFYWLRKLRDAACTKLASLEEPTKNIPVGWVQVGPKVQSTEALDIEIAGCHIQVNARTDPELLKKVCRVLRSL